MSTMTPTLPSKKAQVETVRDYLLSNRRQIELALPRHLSAERFLRTAFTAFSQSPTLYDASTRSLMGALIQCAQLGLEPGVLGQVYLIPFKNRRKGTTEVTVVPGYKGLLELARRSGQISTITAVCVYQGDHYRRTLGTDPKIEHTPSEAPIATRLASGEWERRPLVAVYAVARLKDGGVQFDAMSRSDIEYHRDRFSKAAGEGPWVTDFESMALKTVLRRLAKLLPASIELHQAVALDEHAEAGVSQDLAALVASDPGGAAGLPEGDPPAPGKLEQLTGQLRTERAPTDDEPAPDEAPEEAPDEALEEAPGPAATSEADMARTLVLSLIQTLRDKVAPAPWANILRQRGVGIDALGRTDLAVLEDIVRDLQAVVATTKGRK